MSEPQVTRRNFLRLCGTSSIGLALAACGVTPTPTATPVSTNMALPTSTALPTATPTLTSTPAPTSTATATATTTATPKPPTLRSVGEKLGVYLGTTVDGAEEWQTSQYINAAREHFSVLFPAGSFMQSVLDTPQRGGTQHATEFRRRATADKQVLYIHPAFYHRDFRESLTTASNDDVRKFMDSHVRLLLGFVPKVDGDAKPTFINFINEAIYYYEGKVDWNGSPYYRVFGNRLLTEIYLMFYRAAQEMGLQVGKDLRLIYSDNNIFRPNPKTDFVFDNLARSKREIASALGIPEDKVQFDVAVQYHLDVNNPKKFDGYYTVPTDDEMLTTIKRFAQIGRTHITEFDVAGAQTQAEITDILRRITRTAVGSGLVDSINYWYSLRVFETNSDKRTRDSGKENFYHPIGLFDRNYNPTDVYRALLQDLIELSAKK